MRYDVKKKTIEEKELMKRHANEHDAKVEITWDAEIYCDGELVVVMKKVNYNLNKLRSLLKWHKFKVDTRLSWVKTQSQTFWYRPRSPLRFDYCWKSWAQLWDQIYFELEQISKKLDEGYSLSLPEKYWTHKEQTEKVLPEYKIKWTVFTSWIVNKDNPLKYHYDRGNFDGVYSNMIMIRDWVVWGNLIIPEMDIKLNIQDGYVVMFDWQKILHWVSPIIKTKKDSNRFTIVYYSLKQMRKCLTHEQELIEARKRKYDLYMKRKKILQENKEEWK